MEDFIKNSVRRVLEGIGDNETANKILDKISTKGVGSLSPLEKQWLDKQSKGVEDKETEELLSIDTGHEFVKQLSTGYVAKFVYDSTDDYGDELIHRGTTYIDEFADATEIIYSLIGPNELEYSYYTFYRDNDYVEINNKLLEAELNEFFKEIGDKINKTIEFE